MGPSYSVLCWGFCTTYNFYYCKRGGASIRMGFPPATDHVVVEVYARDGGEVVVHAMQGDGPYLTQRVDSRGQLRRKDQTYARTHTTCLGSTSRPGLQHQCCTQRGCASTRKLVLWYCSPRACMYSMQHNGELLHRVERRWCGLVR